MAGNGSLTTDVDSNGTDDGPAIAEETGASVADATDAPAFAVIVELGASVADVPGALNAPDFAVTAVLAAVVAKAEAATFFAEVFLTTSMMVTSVSISVSSGNGVVTVADLGAVEVFGLELNSAEDFGFQKRSRSE